LRDYNPRCLPEWSERELRHKVLQADVVPFDKERGWLLHADRPRQDEYAHRNGFTRSAEPGGDGPSEPPGAAGPGDGPKRVNEALDDPHRLARLFIEKCCRHKDGSTLRFYREEWTRWDGSAYRLIPEKELRAEVTAAVKAEMDRINLIAQELAEDDQPKPVARKVPGRLIGDVAHALASLTLLPSTVESPAW